MRVVPASVPVVLLTERLTVGKSLSVMVMAWVVVVPRTMPADGLLRVNVAVSLPSIRTSSTTVKVAVPVVCPFAMVIVGLLRV